MTNFQLTRTLDEHAAETALRTDVLHGLTHLPKVLPPKWFYDARGSELFEEITRLPEYYPTRAEREILLERAREIASESGARTLVELGSGSSEKTRHLIEAMPALDTYVPVDVSESALRGRPRPCSRRIRGCGCTPCWRTSHARCSCRTPPGPGWWCSWAARSGTCCRRSVRCSWRPSGRCCRPGTRC